MSHDLCNVEEPYYLLVKEYEDTPKIEDLTEIFVIVYAFELPKWKVKEETDGVEYVFFTSLEKAWKRFKYEGPRKALMKRILTDNDELIELARRNDNIELKEESIEENTTT
jgi:hypothetical protein